MLFHNKNQIILKITLGVAVVVVIILSVLFFQQYKHIRRLDYISAHRQSLFKSLHGSGPLTAANASSTQIWMTFNYINHAFSLPSTYLENNLAVSDSRYPNMTVEEYAKDTGLSTAMALVKVQSAIVAYFATSTGKQ
jgi:hypothetical protein